jgi:hypothetical protein
MSKPEWVNSRLRAFVLNLENHLKQILWTIFFFIVFMTQQIFSWPLVKSSGWGGSSPFIDTRSVLHAAKCSADIGWDIYNPLKWEDCGYIYGTHLIQILRSLSLGPDYTNHIGWFFIIVYSVISGYVLSSLVNLSKLQQASCIFVLVSPGSMLLLERGNFDVLIMLLLFMAAISLSAGRMILGMILISLSALFKFYTLPLLFIACFQLRTSRAKILGLVFSFFTSFLVLKNLSLIKGEFPSNVMASFGNQIPGLYLDYAGIPTSRVSSEILGFVLLILAGISILLFSRGIIPMIQKSLILQERNNLYLQVQLLFISTFLICFFAGVNYDYRIPFLTIPLLLSLTKLQSLGRRIWIVIIPILIVSWTSYNVGFLQVLGDGLILFFTAALLILAFNFLGCTRGGMLAQNQKK